MTILDCTPCYEGRPDYDPAGGTAVLPQETLSRSRLNIGGTFFRSNLLINGNELQGPECNQIALEVLFINQTEDFPITRTHDLIVYYQNTEVERYPVSEELVVGGEGGGWTGGWSTIRATVNSTSQYISMPGRGSDAQDPDVGGFPPSDGDVSDASKTNMGGGSGPNTNNLSSIRTGPQRTIVFISEKEDGNGNPFEPGAGNNLIEYNYDTNIWQPYVIDADCRPEGTPCS